jgi:hypothetical protein
MYTANSMLSFVGLYVYETVNVSQPYKELYHCCIPHEGQVRVTIIMHTLQLNLSASKKRRRGEAVMLWRYLSVCMKYDSVHEKYNIIIKRQNA